MIEIIIISLFCNGWYLITHDGMLFDPVRKSYLNICDAVERSDGQIIWGYNHDFLKFFYKPLFGCIICMASIPGSIAYWIINDFTLDNLTKYPVIIICVAFVNYLLHNISGKLE
jgi:hypothetical protein